MTLQEKLKANTVSLFNSFTTLTPAQVEFKPSSTSWSVLECVEHIFLVDEAISKSISKVATEKIENDKTELLGEGKINHVLVNKREQKVQSPAFAVPMGRFKTIEEAKQNINATIDKIIHHIDTNKIEEETLTIKHPRLGEMTKMDWIHFLIHHTNRHILQIEDVKKLS